MSYSFRLPGEDPTCECKYDALRDRMDRETARSTATWPTIRRTGCGLNSRVRPKRKRRRSGRIGDRNENSI